MEPDTQTDVPNPISGSRGTARAIRATLALGTALAWSAGCSDDGGMGPEPPPPPRNRPPASVGTIPDQTLTLADTARIAVTSYFSDPDGDRLVYSARTSDPGVTAVGVAGDLVTVVALARGSAAVTVTAADPSGREAAQVFEVAVPNSGPATTGTIPNIELMLGDTAAVDVSSHFADADGDVLTLRAETSDAAVVSADAADGVVTVSALARGAAAITVTAADPDGLEARLAFGVTVPNSGPEAGERIADIELKLRDTITVELSSRFSDADGDALSYRAASSDGAVASAEAAGTLLTVRALARGSATIAVTAADPDGLEASLAFEVTVPNSAPEAGQPPEDVEVARGAEVEVDLSSRFSDPDGDALSYRASSSDGAVASAEVVGSLVTVRALARGSARIAVTAADPDGLEASLAFGVTVPNSAPEAGQPPADVEVARGAEVEVELSSRFSDPDGDALMYRAATSDGAVASVEVVGSLVTVRALGRGSATIAVTAADPDGLEASLAFEVTVPNSAPEAGQPPADVEVAQAAALEVDLSSRFSDPDGDVLTYRAASSDGAVASAEAAGTLLTVRALARGSATIAVTAADPDGLEASLAFEVTVPNSAPEAGQPPPDVEVARGAEVEVDLSSRFSDPDGDALSYRAASSDGAVASAEAAGTLLTVRALARGSATIAVTAADPDGLEASLAFEVTVPNSAPEAGQPPGDIEVARGAEVEVDLSSRFSDADGDALSYRASSSDGAVASAEAAGSLVTVRALARGSATIEVTAADPDGLEASLAFEVTVPNSAPEVGQPPGDIEVARGAEVEVDLSSRFSDPDGDALSYRAASSDGAVASAAAAGSLVTVRALARGSATIAVTAADPDGLEASLAFGVTVPNSAPEAGQPPADVEVARGAEVEVDLSSRFSDPDGDALSYRAASSDGAVASAEAVGSLVTVRALARGSATIAVTAVDPDGLEASLAFGVTVPNSAPEITNPIPDVSLFLQEELVLFGVHHFSDPDGDALRFEAHSSDRTVVKITASGESVVVTGISTGSATVTLVAIDPHEFTKRQTFEVTVGGFPSPAFTITLGFTSNITPLQRDAIAAAASHWELILADNNLRDVSFGRPLSCGGFMTNQAIGTVDDLLVLVGAGRVDGPGGTVAFAGPCIVRRESLLPVLGRVVFDLEDIDRFLAAGGLTEVALHEIAHVLGFGTLWDDLGLLVNPSGGLDEVVDTHFTGPAARAAFDAAGGAGYTGAKVPVQNTDSGRDAHWRKSVFPTELMAPSIRLDERAALSAVTIQSLRDLGYSVDIAYADPYSIAHPDLPPGIAGDAGPAIELGDDIWSVPLQIVNEHGRVVRVIPPR